MKGYMKTMFGEQDHAKEIKVKYLVINAPSSYNMIIGQITFNQLEPPCPLCIDA